MADVPPANGPEDTPCWCTQLPPLTAEALQDITNGRGGQPTSTCLCRTCLAAALAFSKIGNSTP
jgi:hypothetical protein